MLPQYWLLKLRPRAAGVQRPATGWANHLTKQRLPAFACCLRRIAISFNGNYYDVPMITAALVGYTAEQLKWLNDRIIVDKVKPLGTQVADWKPADHIDVMEVAPAPVPKSNMPAAFTVRQCATYPMSPTATLTEAEIVEVDEYCGNDPAVLESL